MEAALATIVAVLGWALLVLSGIGTLYLLAAAIIFRRFFARRPIPVRRGDAVTLFKPLHGAEPRLAENLASFLAQDHDGPIQFLAGVQRSDDPAIRAVDSLRAGHPGTAIDLVLDATTHGANGKVSNLINMMPRIAHPVVILSDSDIVAPPDYLATILAALDAPGIGLVTILYCGRGDAGFWSQVGAAGLSYQFLPGAVFGAALGLARPCLGSTIAMRRETLDRIGGFTGFANVLADDYAIGAAVNALGLKIAIPPIFVTHASDEADFSALWRHELRWGVTVRDLVPAAYAGSVIGNPFPLALIGMMLAPADMLGAALALLALAGRAIVARTVDAQVGKRTAPLWLLPARDCLTLAVFVATYFVRSVDWRGQRLRMDENGRISADTEISA